MKPLMLCHNNLFLMVWKVDDHDDAEIGFWFCIYNVHSIDLLKQPSPDLDCVNVVWFLSRFQNNENSHATKNYDYFLLLFCRTALELPLLSNTGPQQIHQNAHRHTNAAAEAHQADTPAIEGWWEMIFLTDHMITESFHTSPTLCSLSSCVCGWMWAPVCASIRVLYVPSEPPETPHTFPYDGLLGQRRRTGAEERQGDTSRSLRSSWVTATLRRRAMERGWTHCPRCSFINKQSDITM